MPGRGQSIQKTALTPAQGKAFKAIMGCAYRDMPIHAPTGLVTYRKEHRDKLYAAFEAAYAESGCSEREFLASLGMNPSLIQSWRGRFPGEYLKLNPYTRPSSEQARQNARLKELTGVERTEERFTKEQRLAIVEAVERLNMPLPQFRDETGVHPSAIYGWRRQFQEETPPPQPPEQLDLETVAAEASAEYQAELETESQDHTHPTGLPLAAPRRPHKRRSPKQTNGVAGTVFYGPQSVPEGVKRFATASVQEAVDMLSMLASAGVDGRTVIMIDTD